MASAPPPPYVNLSENSGSLRPPPYRRNVPRYHKKRGGCGRCCVRFLCCFCCFILLLLLLLACLVLYFFTFYKPQVPSYKFQGFDVKRFDLQPDFSLLTEFLVTVRADNPNEGMGFIYGKDNSVVVSFKDSVLCSGNLPSFHQGHKNTTMIGVPLKGKSEFGSGLQEAFMQNQNSGKIPLLVKVKVPVRIVILHIRMLPLMVSVNCSMEVDNLAPNKKIQILSSSYVYDARVSW